MKSIWLAIAVSMLPVGAQAHQGGHDARGFVSAVSAQELAIKTKHGEEKFVLTPQTEFVRDGSPATLQDLAPSDRVVVHAKKNGTRMEAIEVQFSSAKKR